MAALSWNEIRRRAIEFARDWEGVASERAEAQSFWNDFFQVFGLKRRTIASFEEPVRGLTHAYNRIDLFWKGRLLAEHKSAGEDLGKAASQAFQYVQQLAASGRQNEIPRYIVVSDFTRFVLYDLEPERDTDLTREDGYAFALIHLADLHQHIRHFAFVIGQKVHRFGEEDEANLRAAAIMAKLHDTVGLGKYDPEPLERLLVRLLFCLFAEDTGIFEPSQFELFIENRTHEDGSDLGAQLNSLFDVLNTPEDRRSPHLEEDLAAFPYINGELFVERLPTPSFNTDMREALVSACRFDWSRISPAIFGSLFQGILDAKERRQIGAHYTSERDILKVIRPLFLDDLRSEFAQIKALKQRKVRDQRLIAFQEKIAAMNFLDPACGCGNFLVIAYRELRRLEHELIVLRYGDNQADLPAGEVIKLSKVDVDQFYGIEIGEWPARIAETALWLTDHQMNIELSQTVGNLFQRIPLKASPHILCGNALRVDWNELLPAGECNFVLGNPPFIGAKYQTAEQREDIRTITAGIKNAGLLDYVTLWYLRAADYIRNTDIRCAFVSTNSISQGEQVGVLWGELFRKGVIIHFAHRTFAWESEAAGKAHVHVVIVGFGLHEIDNKRIFEYDDIKGEPSETYVSNIAPYLVENGNITITNRSKPLCDVPEIGIGNKPIDGGLYLFTEEEKEAFLKREPGAAKFFRPWIGAIEFLHGYQRWCLWLGDASPQELRRLPECVKRVKAVEAFRRASKSLPTNKLAVTPTRFHVENFPEDEFLVVPKVSSERRPYIPIGYMKPPTMVSDLCFILPITTPYHFGVLTSKMHMTWTAHVCGRLKSDFRYSAKLVYNNFPWPVNATDAQKAKVEDCANAVLACRQQHIDGGATLADLYDPLVMPVDLRKAHNALDRAVDACYRKARFKSERDRLEYLLALYEELTTLFTTAPARKTRAKRPA